MKAFALFLVLATLAFARDICFPDVFTTDQAIFIPKRDDVLLGRLWWSLPAQKSRQDLLLVVDEDKFVHEKFSILTDFNRETEYTIAYANGTATCRKREIKGKLQPLCLSRNPRHRGTITLGGDLVCDNWVERFEVGRNRTGVAVDVLSTANIDIPIRSFTRVEHQGAIQEEFWNYEARVSHDAFVVPQECQGAQVEGTTSFARTLRSAHPLMKNTRLVASQE